MLYGDTLTLIKQKITNIVVFESICSRPKGVLSEWGLCPSGVLSEWGLVRVGLCPVGLCLSGVLSSGVMSVYRRVTLLTVIWISDFSQCMIHSDQLTNS